MPGDNGKTTISSTDSNVQNNPTGDSILSESQRFPEANPILDSKEILKEADISPSIETKDKAQNTFSISEKKTHPMEDANNQNGNDKNYTNSQIFSSYPIYKPTSSSTSPKSPNYMTNTIINPPLPTATSISNTEAANTSNPTTSSAHIDKSSSSNQIVGSEEPHFEQFLKNPPHSTPLFLKSTSPPGREFPEKIGNETDNANISGRGTGVDSENQSGMPSHTDHPMSEEGMAPSSPPLPTSHYTNLGIPRHSSPMYGVNHSRFTNAANENGNAGGNNSNSATHPSSNNNSNYNTSSSYASNASKTHNNSTTSSNPPVTKVSKNDALLYLDQLKTTFADQPQIYNKFLEIMKEFKAQIIDTYTVVEKVTNLFAGNPHLIEGFNQFLPQDSKIKLTPSKSSYSSYGGVPSSASASAPSGQEKMSEMSGYGSSYLSPMNPIAGSYGGSAPFGMPSSRGYYPPHHLSTMPPTSSSVQSAGSGNIGMGTPTGGTGSIATANATSGSVTSAGTGVGGAKMPMNPALSSSQRYTGPSWSTDMPAAGYAAASYMGNLPPTGPTTLGTPHNAMMYPSLTPSAPGTQAPSSMYGSSTYQPSPAAASGTLGPLPSAEVSAIAGPGVRKPSMGMMQAVSYLKKIQDRFYKEPHIYNVFVNILRSYQREQKSIKEVYDQVASLFGAHTDLLEEFAQFIPDAHGLFGRSGAGDQQTPGIGFTPGSSRAPGSTSLGAPVPASHGIGPGASPYETSHPSVTAGPTFGRRSTSGISAQKMEGYGKVSGTGHPHYPSAALTAEQYYGKRSSEAKRMEGSAREMEFFNRVKKHFQNNDQVYSEFLKCLNWYSQDIIKKSELVKLAQSFIGNSNELFSTFKQMIHYTEPHAESSGSQLGESDNQSVEALFPDLSSCRRIRSYRFLPKAHQFAACSGRTALCNEVLNDQLVSCPSFNSEDSTFISSKKNIYEEALFRCEDERYELDRLIDANQATIANFEPIYRKIESLPSKEAEKMTLNDNLGGSSEIIYRNVIQKIYGPKADEVLDALKRMPSASVGVVLRRLKQKDEEWRMAQREWNKIWRDIHFKNYYKALDNIGLGFKSADKKILSSKSLVNEIQTVYYEQLNTLASGSGGPMGINVSIPPVHLLPSCQGIPLLEKTDEELAASVKPTLLTGFPSILTGTPQMEFKIRDKSVLEDLLKLILYLNGKSSSFNLSEKRSLENFILNFLPDFFSSKVIANSNSPSSVEKAMDDVDMGESKSALESMKITVEPINSDDKYQLSESDTQSVPTEFNLIYGNDYIYSFFRLFQISYHRLEQMKSFCVHHQDNPLYYHKKNYVATFLDLQKKSSNHQLPSQTDYYEVLLELITRLIDGDLEQGSFEEKTRLLFGPSAYIVFTFDRVLYSLLKQALLILGDTTSEHLIALYDSFKRPKKGSTFSEYSYRVAARSLLGHDVQSDLFLMESQKETEKKTNPDKNYFSWWLRFRYLCPPQRGSLDTPREDAGSPDGTTRRTLKSQALSAHDQWLAYIDAFVGDLHYDPSVWRRKPPLLRVHDLEKAQRRSSNRLKRMVIHYNMECKICIHTYKMFFVDHTEDFILKRSILGKRKPFRPPVQKKKNVLSIERFRKWLDNASATHMDIHG